MQRLQLAAVINLLCLVGLIVVTEIWLLGAPVNRIWLLLTLLPLLLALRGFLHGRRYTFQWMSMVIWLYFAAGVVRTWVASSHPALVYGVLEIILTLSLFALCCGYARSAGNLRRP